MKPRRAASTAVNLFISFSTFPDERLELLLYSKKGLTVVLVPAFLYKASPCLHYFNDLM